MWICDCCSEINNNSKKECSYCGLKKTVRTQSQRKPRSATYAPALFIFVLICIAVIVLAGTIPAKNYRAESNNYDSSVLTTVDDSSGSAMQAAADINTLSEGKYSIHVISALPSEKGTELLFRLKTRATFTDDYVAALSVGSEITIDTMCLTVESFDNKYVYFDYGFLFRKDDGLWYACHPSDAGMFTLSETCYQALIPYSSITVVDNTLLKNEQLRDAYMLSDRYGEYDASVYIRNGEITHLEKEYRP